MLWACKKKQLNWKTGQEENSVVMSDLYGEHPTDGCVHVARCDVMLVAGIARLLYKSLKNAYPLPFQL
jgi:hypothetical protein